MTDQPNGPTYALFASFAADPARALPEEDRPHAAAEAQAALESTAATVRGAYTVTGYRADADLLLWLVGHTADEVQDTLIAFRRTALGRALRPAWSGIGVHREAEFAKSHTPAFMRGEAPCKYVSVYPYVRSLEWYLLPEDERSVDLYVNFFNRHDGAGAVQLLTTPIRTVCRNTWDMAVGSAVNSFSIRHVGSPSTRIAEARTALGLSIDYTKQFKRFGDRLAKQKVAERKVLQIASELWPDNGSERQIRNAQARREAVLRLFTDSATIGNAPGTKWCAANALLEQLEWGSGARSPEGRFLRHISDQCGLKARALELVLDA